VVARREGVETLNLLIRGLLALSGSAAQPPPREGSMHMKRLVDAVGRLGVGKIDVTIGFRQS